MADEVQGSIRGGNGERLEVRVGGQQIGVSARDLIPILMLIVAAVAGYLVFMAIDAHLRKSDALHLEIYKAVETHDDHLDAKVEKLSTLMHEQNEKLADQTEQIRLMLISLDFNIGRKIEERIPLELGSVLRQRGLLPSTPPAKE